MTIEAPPPAGPASARGIGHRVACSATGTLLGLTQGLGLYLVSSNLASIQGSLGATAAEASWLTTSYFATALSSTLLLTKVRLQFGLRPFAQWGLLCFVVVAALHLAADTVVSAASARAALGLVAAPLSTLAVLYWMEAFPTRLAAVGLLCGFASLQLGLPLSRVVSTDLLEIGRWHGLFLLDVALAVLCLAAIHAVELTPTPRQQAFDRGDLPAFFFYGTGLALICVAVSQGRLYWWTDTPWLGQCLAAGIACLGIYVAIDVCRARPLINLRWLATPYMLRFVAAVLLFRIVLSEQTVGVVGLMTLLGQSNEQMQALFALVTVATLVGFLLAIVIAARDGAQLLAVLAIALVVAAAWLDARATALTRPEQLLVSQTLMALALAVFFSAACLLGFGPVMQDGGRNLVSFLAVFSACQYMGSLLGTASIQTLVARRQQWHFAALAQRLTADDPGVAARLGQLSRSVAGHVNDPTARGLQGVSLFVQQVTRESFVLAYNDVFQYIAGLGVLMLGWLVMLAWRAHRRQRLAAAAGGSSAAPIAS